jgi:dUTP pyrophosphatase
MIIVKFKRLNENAKVPVFKHIGDAGKDLYATSMKYNPKYDRYEYGLGFATNIPEGYQVSIRPRSSNTKTEAYIPNAPGTIDSGYTGEWNVFFKLRNTQINNNPELHAPYKIGDAIAQAILEKVEEWEFLEVDELEETERGSDGGLLRDDLNFK